MKCPACGLNELVEYDGIDPYVACLNCDYQRPGRLDRQELFLRAVEESNKKFGPLYRRLA